MVSNTTLVHEIRTGYPTESGKPMTQAELADWLDLDQSNISRLERGEIQIENIHREARFILLGMAGRIPEDECSEDLNDWVGRQRVEFQKKPLGGLFR